MRESKIYFIIPFSNLMHIIENKRIFNSTEGFQVNILAFKTCIIITWQGKKLHKFINVMCRAFHEHMKNYPASKMLD